MENIRYTLVSDGSSDKALLPILSWLLYEHTVNKPIQSEWADLRRLPKPPKTLSEKIKIALDLYPCDLLFIHRDAEKEPRQTRIKEILKAIESLTCPPSVCVIPVRMQEAWLLFDEAAIRRAAGNPRGKTLLRLPDISRAEELPNPKKTLYHLLRDASGFSGHRLKKLNIKKFAINISVLIKNYAPLRALSAFNVLENDLKNIINENGWGIRGNNGA